MTSFSSSLSSVASFRGPALSFIHHKVSADKKKNLIVLEGKDDADSFVLPAFTLLFKEFPVFSTFVDLHENLKSKKPSIVTEVKKLEASNKAEKDFSLLFKHPSFYPHESLQLVFQLLQLQNKGKNNPFTKEEVDKAWTQLQDKWNVRSDAPSIGDVWDSAIEKYILPSCDASVTVDQIKPLLQVLTRAVQYNYGLSRQQYSAVGLYPKVGTHIRHSCVPNCCMLFRKDVKNGTSAHNYQMMLFSTRPISPGEELTISFGVSRSYFPEKRTRQHVIQSQYQFQCDCRACLSEETDNGAEEAKSLFSFIEQHCNQKRILQIMNQMEETKKLSSSLATETSSSSDGNIVPKSSLALCQLSEALLMEIMQTEGEGKKVFNWNTSKKNQKWSRSFWSQWMTQHFALHVERDLHNISATKSLNRLFTLEEAYTFAMENNIGLEETDLILLTFLYWTKIMLNALHRVKDIFSDAVSNAESHQNLMSSIEKDMKSSVLGFVRRRAASLSIEEASYKYFLLECMQNDCLFEKGGSKDCGFSTRLITRILLQ